MVPNKNTESTPLTFDVQLGLYNQIKSIQKSYGFMTASHLVRHAIKNYNFRKFSSPKKDHKQLSVRLPSEIKTYLTKVSKDKNVSMGELLRATLEALQYASEINSKKSKTMVTKKTTKTVKKVAAKKVVKKAVVKKAVKKVAAKKTVKKVAAKKK